MMNRTPIKEPTEEPIEKDPPTDEPGRREPPVERPPAEDPPPDEQIGDMERGACGLRQWQKRTSAPVRTPHGPLWFQQYIAQVIPLSALGGRIQSRSLKIVMGNRVDGAFD
jgi:hypothetical protein